LADNQDEKVLPAVVGRLALDQPDDQLGRIIMALNDVYLASDIRPSNATWWFRYLQTPEKTQDDPTLSQVTLRDTAAVLDALADVRQMLDHDHSTDEQALAYKAQLQWAVDISQWACARMAVLCGDTNRQVQSLATPAEFEQCLDTYRRLWLSGSRIGGLKDSVAKLSKWQQVENDNAANDSQPHLSTADVLAER
jgi:hypothetical protein